MSACRSCRAPILWVQTEKGRMMPLDREPYTGDKPGGLFVIRRTVVDGREKVLAVAVSPDSFPGEAVYQSHFATCDRPNEWRKG